MRFTSVYRSDCNVVYVFILATSYNTNDVRKKCSFEIGNAKALLKRYRLELEAVLKHKKGRKLQILRIRYFYDQLSTQVTVIPGWALFFNGLFQLMRTPQLIRRLLEREARSVY